MPWDNRENDALRRIVKENTMSSPEGFVIGMPIVTHNLNEEIGRGRTEQAVVMQMKRLGIFFGENTMGDGKHMEKRKSNFQGTRWSEAEIDFFVKLLNQDKDYHEIQKTLNENFGNNRTIWAVRKRGADTIKTRPDILSGTVLKGRKKTAIVWPKDEIEVMYELRKEGLTCKKIASNLNTMFGNRRTARAVQNKLTKSAGDNMRQVWTKEQIDYLVNLKQMGTSFEDIAAMMAGEFGVTRSPAAVKSKYHKETGESYYEDEKPRRHNTHWSDEDDEFVLTNMGRMTNEAIAQRLHRTDVAVRDRVSLLSRMQPVKVVEPTEDFIPRRWKVRHLKAQYKRDIKVEKANHRAKLKNMKKELRNKIKEL